MAISEELFSELVARVVDGWTVGSLTIPRWCDGSTPCSVVEEPHGHWRGGAVVDARDVILRLIDDYNVTMDRALRAERERAEALDQARRDAVRADKNAVDCSEANARADDAYRRAVADMVHYCRDTKSESCPARMELQRTIVQWDNCKKHLSAAEGRAEKAEALRGTITRAEAQELDDAGYAAAQRALAAERDRDGWKARAEAAERDEAAALTREAVANEAVRSLDRRLSESITDRLFAEGARDAARCEAADLRDHLKAASSAHEECEAELVRVRRELALVKDERDTFFAVARSAMPSVEGGPVAVIHQLIAERNAALAAAEARGLEAVSARAARDIAVLRAEKAEKA